MPHKITPPGQGAVDVTSTWPKTFKEICDVELTTPTTESSCICRFATSKVPLKLHFFDVFYNYHEVEIKSDGKPETVIFPSRGFIEWMGDEKDTTQLTGGTEFVKAEFLYEPAGALNSHGISIKIKAYHLPTPSAMKAVSWDKFVQLQSSDAKKDTSVLDQKLAKGKAEKELLLKELKDLTGGPAVTPADVEALKKTLDTTTKEKVDLDTKIKNLDTQIAAAKAEKERLTKQLQAPKPNGATPFIPPPEPEVQQTCCKRNCVIS